MKIKGKIYILDADTKQPSDIRIRNLEDMLKPPGRIKKLWRRLNAPITYPKFED